MLDRYFERMKAIVERHGGTVEKFIGDARHGRLRRARCCTTTTRFARVARRVRCGTRCRSSGSCARIGLATGEVLTGTEEALATGTAVNLAARLEQAASRRRDPSSAPQTARASSRERSTLSPVEPLNLKGYRRRRSRHRLITAAAGAPARSTACADGRPPSGAASAARCVRAGGARPLLPAVHDARCGRYR